MVAEHEKVEKLLTGSMLESIKSVSEVWRRNDNVWHDLHRATETEENGTIKLFGRRQATELL